MPPPPEILVKYLQSCLIRIFKIEEIGIIIALPDILKWQS